MNKYRTKQKKVLYAAILAIGLGLTATGATARTVEGSSDMCGAAKGNRDSAVRKEIEIIKQTHEMMEISRSVHAQCMKQINEIVGEKISSIDSGDGGIMGTFSGLLGQVNEVFDLSGKVCSAIQSKVSDEQQKIADAIAKAEPLLDKAGQIAKKGKEVLDKAQPEIDKAVDKIKSDSAKKEAEDKLYEAIKAGEVQMPDGYKPPKGKPMPNQGLISSSAPRSATPNSASSFQAPAAASTQTFQAPQQSPQRNQAAPTPPPSQTKNPWESISNILNSR